MLKYMTFSLLIFSMSLSAGQNLYERNRDHAKPKCKKQRECSKPVYYNPEPVDDSDDDPY